jgi:hypothetical protein
VSSASFVLEPKIGKGSLLKLIEELYEVERQIHPDLTVYRWQPPVVELPCLANWLGESPFGFRDQRRAVDEIVILARIMVQATDDRMDRLALYADSFRAYVDEALYVSQPLNGAAFRARRDGMRQFVPQLAEGISAVGFEFPLAFECPRIIEPN